MEQSFLSPNVNDLKAPQDDVMTLYQNTLMRKEIGLSVQETVRDYLQLATSSLADVNGTLSYFSDIVENDLAANVNGYDRIMADWSQVQGAAIIGSIVNHVSQELVMIYGLKLIEQLRLEVFGPNGGCVSHGNKWVSQAIKLYAPDYRIETTVEDFVLWLCVRAARRLILEDGIGARRGNPPKEKE